jgi:hypothetical protein
MLCSSLASAFAAPEGHAWVFNGVYWGDGNALATQQCQAQGKTFRLSNNFRASGSGYAMDYQCLQNGWQVSSYSLFTTVYDCAYVGESGQCTEPPPPQNINCDFYTDTWTSAEIAFIPEGSEAIASFCAQLYNTDDNNCSNVLGYFNKVQVCGDDQDECAASGGTYGGIVRAGELGWTPTCLPSEFGDDIPTCDISSVTVLNIGADQSGGFACASPVDPPLEDDVTQEPPPETDTDGDGVPDSQDPDIDGDGIPNGSDTDVDGDGVENGDDLTPNGDVAQSSVSGGGSCAARPVCAGDAVQCAILFQSWKNRCANENPPESSDGGIPSIDQPFSFASAITGALTDLGETSDEISDSIAAGGSNPDPLGLGVTAGAEGTFGVLTQLFPASTSCADISWNVFGKGTFVISCSKLSPLRDLLGFLFAALTIFYIANLVMERPS